MLPQITFKKLYFALAKTPVDLHVDIEEVSYLGPTLALPVMRIVVAMHLQSMNETQTKKTLSKVAAMKNRKLYTYVVQNFYECI